MKTFVLHNEVSGEYLDCGLRKTLNAKEAQHWNSPKEASDIFNSCLPFKTTGELGWVIVEVSFNLDKTFAI